MSRFKLVVRINAAAGKDAEFNEWYDSQHLNDVLAVPGFKAAERYTSVAMAEPAKFQYVTLYEIEAKDVRAVFAELQARVTDGRIAIASSLEAELEFEIIEFRPQPPPPLPNR